MKNMKYFSSVALSMVLAVFVLACNAPVDNTTSEKASEMAAKPDMTKIKADIQALETAWAAAVDAKDLNATVAFYAEDAVSLSNNQPMITGKAAITKDVETWFSKRDPGTTTAYDVMEVFGTEDLVTEIGKTTIKDANGNATRTGKYMAIWEKRNGKYVCIRDISNDDAKPE